MLRQFVRAAHVQSLFQGVCEALPRLVDELRPVLKTLGLNDMEYQSKPTLNVVRLSDDIYSRLVALIVAREPNRWQSIPEVLKNGKMTGRRIISQFATFSTFTMHQSHRFSIEQQHQGNSRIKYRSSLRRQIKFGQINELFTHTGSDENPEPSQQFACVHPFDTLSSPDQAHAERLTQSHHRMHVISDRLAPVSEKEVIPIGDIKGHFASRQFSAGFYGFQDGFLLIVDLTAYDDI